MNKNIASMLLLALAFVALVPGVTQTVLELSGSVEKAELAQLGKDAINGSEDILPMFRGLAARLIDTLETEGSVVVYDQSRSILGTVKELWTTGNAGVAFLVMLFSVIVPVLKGALILIANLGRQLTWRGHALDVAGAISKWSMADVFVIGVIVAFLAANASGDAGEMVTFNAKFGSGFYFFLTYCVLSIASAQIMPRDVAPSQRAHKPRAAR